MIKTTLVILAVFVVPGVVMGVISSYRAGQRPHRDVYLRFKKFAQRK
jgi:preprotein translocase subunit SecG